MIVCPIFCHLFLQCLRACYGGIIYDGAVCRGSLENGLSNGFLRDLYSLWVFGRGWGIWGTDWSSCRLASSRFCAGGGERVWAVL